MTSTIDLDSRMSHLPLEIPDDEVSMVSQISVDFESNNDSANFHLASRVSHQPLENPDDELSMVIPYDSESSVSMVSQNQGNDNRGMTDDEASLANEYQGNDNHGMTDNEVSTKRQKNGVNLSATVSRTGTIVKDLFEKLDQEEQEEQKTREEMSKKDLEIQNLKTQNAEPTKALTEANKKLQSGKTPHGELVEAKKELKQDAVELHFKIYTDDESSAVNLFFPLKTQEEQEEDEELKIVNTTLRDLIVAVWPKIMAPYLDYITSEFPALKKLDKKNFPVEVTWMSISHSSCKPIPKASFPLRGLKKTCIASFHEKYHTFSKLEKEALYFPIVPKVQLEEEKLEELKPKPKSDHAEYFDSDSD
ncbi:expressed unknown protein [Seminavis robusta]|uniref:Uncharacterized protein n=1 Tax=Seminavis robusta TaxID=568900 RepID=A0A9N8H2Y4_9STRA|nr:expressed unknown protein [Seminavis robusta]|eukprot:Sro17_g012110.1 n/a (363) ;mRNA; f:33496-34584